MRSLLDVDPLGPQSLRPLHDPQLQTVSLQQISDQYQVCTKTLRSYIHEGHLRATKIGRSYQVTIAALKEFLGEAERHSVPIRPR